MSQGLTKTQPGDRGENGTYPDNYCAVLKPLTEWKRVLPFLRLDRPCLAHAVCGSNQCRWYFRVVFVLRDPDVRDAIAREFQLRK